MGCCGGRGNKKLRSQTVPKKSTAKKATKVQRVGRKAAAKPISVNRQHVVPHARCKVCGYPAMLVNIGGRERQQCSNANCRQIIK